MPPENDKWKREREALIAPKVAIKDLGKYLINPYLLYIFLWVKEFINKL